MSTLYPTKSVTDSCDNTIVGCFSQVLVGGAIVLLIVFGIRKNHRLKEEERELTEQIEAFEKKLTEEHSVERTD